MEIAHAQLQRVGKGEDALTVRGVGASGSEYLLAVADGLSLNGGGAAALWIKHYLENAVINGDIRDVFQSLKNDLATAKRQHEESETTLTCGLLRQVGRGLDAFLRFEFFAIGDSPIWKVVAAEGRYPYQRLTIHGAPYPGETARVYGTVRLHKGDIKGAVSFGSADVAAGEILVLCTDGIPEREVFVRDAASLQSKCPSGEGGLCNWLFNETPFQNESLEEVLATYARRGVLFDDATIIAARLEKAKHTAPVTSQEVGAGAMRSDAPESSASLAIEEGPPSNGSAPESLVLETSESHVADAHSSSKTTGGEPHSPKHGSRSKRYKLKRAKRW